MKQAPALTQLYNVERWYQDSIMKTQHLQAVLYYGKPYAIAKSLKRQEELKGYPKGTYFKLPKHS